MATFLELVNMVERESGTVNLHSRTTDVASPGSGRQEKIIAHVNEAYRQIQVARSDWPWRLDDFSHILIIGQARYAAADLGISSFSSWKPAVYREKSPFSLYDPAMGKRDETELRYLAWADWRSIYDMGDHDAQRPSCYAVDREGKLCLGPKPDKAYMLRGTYQRGVHRLAVNANEPILPEDSHNLIAWKALTLLHGHDEGQFALGNAAIHYQADFRTLVNSVSEMVGD